MKKLFKKPLTIVSILFVSIFTLISCSNSDDSSSEDMEEDQDTTAPIGGRVASVHDVLELAECKTGPGRSGGNTAKIPRGRRSLGAHGKDLQAPDQGRTTVRA